MDFQRLNSYGLSVNLNRSLPTAEECLANACKLLLFLWVPHWLRTRCILEVNGAS